MNSTKIRRIIALIDMDCFYVQVEQRDKPELWGKPTAVVQYNQWKKGGIIAVGYEARSRGVKRGMRGEEALTVCPDLNLVSVPTQREKANLTKYRQASCEVFQTISSFEGITIERASVDEAYLDLTDIVEKEYEANFTPFSLSGDDIRTTFLAIEGPQTLADWLLEIQKENNVDDIKLALGAKMVEKIRQKILDETKFHCSAGIAQNKMLAKLVCCLHKPKQQTVIPSSLIQELFKTTPIQNVRLLGGKLGTSVVEKLGINTMAELSLIPLPTLQELFSDVTGRWLHDLSLGNDDEPVVLRQLPKSIGCSKNFPGKNALHTKKDVNTWLKHLSDELEERLLRDQTANHRFAKTFTVGIRTEGDSSAINCTRQTSLHLYSSDSLVKEATRLLQEFNSAPKDSVYWKPAITCLSLGAGKFEDNVDIETLPITDYFKPVTALHAVESSRDTPEKVKKINDDSVELGRKATPSSNDGLNGFFTKVITERNSTNKQQSAEKSRDECLPVKTLCGQVQTKRILLTSDDDAKEEMTKNISFIGSDEQKMNEIDRQTPLSSGSDDLFDKQYAGCSRIDTPPPSGVDVKKGEHSHSSVPEIWLDLPESRADIDNKLWRDLPHDIRFELTQFYKKQSANNSQSSSSQESNKNKRPTSKATNRKTKNKPKSKSPAAKTKKVEKCFNGTTLFDFYNKL